MKNKILIIRSASFQQLDSNLIEIKKKFPRHKIHLLTHEHGVKLAEKYNMIDKIIIYPDKSAFSDKIHISELANTKLDAVVVLVSNHSGSGFDNVFRFAHTIKAKQIFMCNPASELLEMSNKAIRRNELNKIICTMLVAALSIIILPFLLIISCFKIINSTFANKKL